MSTLPTFPEFFRAVHGYDPFPWQTMLADKVVAGVSRAGFPDAVDLPTASGKTACLDIAVYALAAQAEKPLGQRTAARRIWFVVDRRIVVDEAFERARKLAAALEKPTAPALRAIAERLLKLRGLPNTERPLAVGRLRGGVLRDDRWARIPSQAAIITSTVDQIGSRLLFRGYGAGALTAPIFSGLAGNDSLILLDEAHCAVPFLQTLRAVARFRSRKWSEIPNSTPFQMAILSATPPGSDDDSPLDIFPAAEARVRALDHPTLQARLSASKKAELKAEKNEPKLTEAIADAAASWAREGRQRVGVIVNRVGRASEIADALREQLRKTDSKATPPPFDVHLLTGRIRPVERDLLIGKDADGNEAPLHRRLRAVDPESPPRPLILVATQCLEVGADFSFDALAAECASLDALRQRFGRLDRLGAFPDSPAAIFTADSLLKDSDPIYGDALKNTWEFLLGNAIVENPGAKNERRLVDFGVNALEPFLPDGDDLRKLLAPSLDAPVLLPAHLDLLCQTSPLPHPDPDLAPFLHGKQRGVPEVRVIFRCDLDPRRPDDWPEIVSLCRPVTGEMLSVPIRRFREWLRLRDRIGADRSGDVEGAADDASEATKSDQSVSARLLLWRGRDRSEVVIDPTRIPPGGIVVLPVPENPSEIEALGQALREQGLGRDRLDLWELAWQRTGRPAMLRLHGGCLDPWLPTCPALRALFDLIDTGEWRIDDLRDALAAARDWTPEDPTDQPLPNWLRNLFASVLDVRASDIDEHPAGGIVLRGRNRQADDRDETDFFADDEDAMSDATAPVRLAEHSDDVEQNALLLAKACLGNTAESLFGSAARWHDTGKLDPRFQAMLNGGFASTDEPLAKSPSRPRSRNRGREIAEAAELPARFRHEMLSMQLAERFAHDGIADDERDLFLHLIASHHGHARPFAPVCIDADPPPIDHPFDGATLRLTAENRRAIIPSHRLDSGVSDRFWKLVRRYGWWGLAYREAILRLADWHASAHPRSRAK